MCNDFIQHYKWCLRNKIVLPESGDEQHTLEELIIKRYKRKTYLTFRYYSENKIYNELKTQMLAERCRLEYWITIVNLIIRNTKLYYDLRYIFVRFLC